LQGSLRVAARVRGLPTREQLLADYSSDQEPSSPSALRTTAIPPLGLAPGTYVLQEQRGW
jgi:hypothetical protein